MKKTRTTITRDTLPGPLFITSEMSDPEAVCQIAGCRQPTGVGVCESCRRKLAEGEPLPIRTADLEWLRAHELARLNPNWLAYCRVNGRGPNEQLAHDEGSMLGFMLWIRERAREFYRAHPEAWIDQYSMWDHARWGKFLQQYADKHQPEPDPTRS